MEGTGIAHLNTRQTMKHNRRVKFRKQSLHFQQGLGPLGRSGNFGQDDVQDELDEKNLLCEQTTGMEKTKSLVNGA